MRMFSSLISELREWRVRRRTLGELREIGRSEEDEQFYVFEDRIDGARLSWINGQRDEAVRVWEEVSCRYADITLQSPKALRLLIDMGRFDEAEALANQGIKRFPHQLFYFDGLAQIARRRGDGAEAVRRWAIVRQKFPGSVSGYIQGAACLREVGEIDNATVLLRLALRRFPHEVDCWLEDARFAEARGDLPYALNAWVKLSNDFPQHAVCKTGLASCLEQLGEYKEAESILEAAKTSFPVELSVWSNLAWLAHHRADWPLAATRWAMVTKRFPLMTLGYSNQIIALRELGRWAEMDEVLVEAVGRFPSDVSFALAHAMLSHERQAWQEANSRWETFRIRFPTRDEGFLYGAEALDRVGEHSKGEELRNQRRDVSSSIKALSEMPDLPTDFDPIAYLEMNPDVAAAGMKAADHYLNFGFREGRRWRAESDVAAKEERRPSQRQASTPRRVVFLGNCQANVYKRLYDEKIAPHVGDEVSFVASFGQVTDEAKSLIAKADVLVAQVFDGEQEIGLHNIDTSAEIVTFPLVTGMFLWPFGGVPHPLNKKEEFLPTGPYDLNMGDRFLNKAMHRSALDPETISTIADEYLALDLASIGNAGRMYELIIDRQRRRDDQSGFSCAALIERNLHDVALFYTPSTFSLPLFHHVVESLYARLGAPKDVLHRMLERMLRSPFPTNERPIHPSVAKFFDLSFVGPNQKYVSPTGEYLTLRDYVVRYLQYDWNESLLRGCVLAEQAPRDSSREVIEENIQLLSRGLQRSSGSGRGERALSSMFMLLGDSESAFEAYARSIALEPNDPNALGHYSHLLMEEKKIAEAEEILLAAIRKWPQVAHLWGRLGGMLVREGRLGDAAEIIKQAMVWHPDDNETCRFHDELQKRVAMINQ